MNEYITFHKIIDEFRTYQTQSPILNSFGFGDLVYFSTVNSGDTATYPYMFVTPQSVNYDENITTYSIQVIFADRVNENLSNQVDVVSDMSIEAKRFLSSIKRGMNTFPYMYNNFDVTLPVTSTVFMERFNDHVGGIVLNLDLTIFEDINACDYYVSPSPSPSPTTTPTPTPSPTDTVPCTQYKIDQFSFSNFGAYIGWTDCEGNPQTSNQLVFGPGTITRYVCAQLGSVIASGGSTNTITNIGTCVAPGPTPSLPPVSPSPTPSTSSL